MTHCYCCKRRSVESWEADKRQELLALVKEFYNTIPTRLPSRIDPDQIVREFVSDLHEQEDRLDQLEAGLATHTATLKGQNPLGDVEIKVTSATSKAYEQVVDYVLRTAGGSLNVQDVFTIEIPKERNLATIDALIAASTDENEKKELKQQKRLLRNRQAA